MVLHQRYARRLGAIAPLLPVGFNIWSRDPVGPPGAAAGQGFASGVDQTLLKSLSE